MFNIHKDRGNKQVEVMGSSINEFDSSNFGFDLVGEFEKNYRDIFESVNDALILLDKRGVILDVNKKLTSACGYDKADLIGKHITSLNNILPPKSLATITKNFFKRIFGIQPPTYEVEMIKKSGELMTVEVNAVAIRKDGRIAGDLAILRDLTEQRRSEEILRESEEMYRDLFESTNDLIQSVTPEGHFKYVNNAWLKTLGYSEEEVTYLKIWDIIHPEYLQDCEMLFHQLMSGKDIASFETAFINKIGQKILVEGNVNCRFKDGKPIYTRGIFRNVTERKRIEDQMLRLASAVWMSTDIIILTDLDSKIVDANEAALKMLGAESKDRLIGKNFMALISPTWREKALEDIHEVWEKGYSRDREYQFISNNGQEKNVEIKSSLVKSAGGQAIGFVRVGSVVNDNKKLGRLIEIASITQTETS